MLAAILVSVLLRHLLGLTGVKRNKVVKKQQSAGHIDMEQVEENIHETDLNYYIRQALEENNFALAIRLYYLAILKELSLKKAIKLKKDKTNRDYLREMAGSEMTSPFRELTYIFERVWYGKEQLDQENFQELEPKFQRFVQQVKTYSPS